MSLDNVREPHISPAVRDDLEDIKSKGFSKYVSPWVSIEGTGFYDFPHGLREIPHVASVLEATDSQGTGQAVASNVTIASTVTMVRVTNTGAARYFRVRAF